MPGGQRSKKSYFFLDNKKKVIITEEKVTLLAEKFKCVILFFTISERISLRYFATKPQQRHSCKSSGSEE